MIPISVLHNEIPRLRLEKLSAALGMTSAGIVFRDAAEYKQIYDRSCVAINANAKKQEQFMKY